MATADRSTPRARAMSTLPSSSAAPRPRVASTYAGSGGRRKVRARSYALAASAYLPSSRSARPCAACAGAKVSSPADSAARTESALRTYQTLSAALSAFLGTAGALPSVSHCSSRLSLLSAPPTEDDVDADDWTACDQRAGMKSAWPGTRWQRSAPLFDHESAAAAPLIIPARAASASLSRCLCVSALRSVAARGPEKRSGRQSRAPTRSGVKFSSGAAPVFSTPWNVSPSKA